MEIKSRKDEIVRDKATGKFRKTSIITSEMTEDELRKYLGDLTRHAERLEIEINSVRSEIGQMERLLKMGTRGG